MVPIPINFNKVEIGAILANPYENKMIGKDSM
jgi:hypothetical protein